MKLADYLRQECIQRKGFAKKCGITYQTLLKAIYGYDILLSTAIAIEIGTHGNVTCKDMQPTQTSTYQPRPKSVDKNDK
jgi:predicted transcriptional regulator